MIYRQNDLGHIIYDYEIKFDGSVSDLDSPCRIGGESRGTSAGLVSVPVIVVHLLR